LQYRVTVNALLPSYRQTNFSRLLVNVGKKLTEFTLSVMPDIDFTLSLCLNYYVVFLANQLIRTYVEQWN
jgi:hypothetical protein